MSKVSVACCSHVQTAGAAQKKKESIIDLTKYIDKAVRVKFSGGREGDNCPSQSLMNTVTGVLKGFDQLVNLVLDDCVEHLRGCLAFA